MAVAAPRNAGRARNQEHPVRFGIFDHCERNSRAPGVTYQERFKLAQRAEKAGFYAYHLAEHHGTSLSLAPSPSVFLAALAQHTSTLRLGALVYLLPLYDPYRLAQEIGMLDHLSGGRLELGLGRGANPVELGFFGLTPATAKERFDEDFRALMQGLTEGRMTLMPGGATTVEAPIDLRLSQIPYPPLWYPSSAGGASLAWAASQGFNTIVNGPLDACAEAIEMFKDHFRPGPHGAAPKVGLTRYVFAAETDAEALRVGREAFAYHLANLTKLARAAGVDMSNSPIMPPADLEEAVRVGFAAVGSPATVREQLGRIFDRTGANYFAFAPMMADLPLEWGLRSIDIFENEIMPAFAGAGA